MNEEAQPDGVADFIRSRSKAGKLTGSADLEAEWNCPKPDRLLEPPEPLIQEITSLYHDIDAVTDAQGRRFYYSETFMSGAYAKVLVLKGEGPLRMMAEVIREHSKTYRRPVPASLFQYSPFDLSDEQIAAGLEHMAQQELYRDLAQLVTSIGNLFVYSTHYLDGDHAAMLAEWLDVGEVENP